MQEGKIQISVRDAGLKLLIMGGARGGCAPLRGTMHCPPCLPFPRGPIPRAPAYHLLLDIPQNEQLISSHIDGSLSLSLSPTQIFFYFQAA